MRLKKKRNYVHGDGGATSLRSRGDRLAKTGTHKGEDYGFKVGAGGGIRKDALREGGTVDSAVGGKDAAPETRDDWLHCGTAGGLEFMDNVVCVDKLNAKLPEELGKQALPAGDSAC